MNVSSEFPEWHREEKSFFHWVPARSLLGCIRSYQREKSAWNPVALLGGKWQVICHRFWTVMTGADIPLNCHIDGGLLLPHPNGVVIHPNAKIGPNCLIFQQVTIGTKGSSQAPIIGGHVDIGAGAKILGAITIGNHCLIGANAVVLTDVPDYHMAVGIPATVKPIKPITTS